ncbi:MAG: orotidine-5'-phosphate decarboxylase [Fibrobacterota bacterium]
MSPEDRIIIALDTPIVEKAMDLSSKIRDKVSYFKIGKEIFTSAGPDAVIKIKQSGVKVFLDLKYHDIPNTVAKAGIAAASLGADMFNVHASGGLEMMKKCAGEVKDFCAKKNIAPPLIIAVTILTSIPEERLNKELNMPGPLIDRVLLLAELAKKSGLDGVVCSPAEIKSVKENIGSDFLTVSPGIRPSWAARNDQARITTPAEAVAAGGDYLVIGRPVTASEDPSAAAAKILDEIRNQ